MLGTYLRGAGFVLLAALSARGSAAVLSYQTNFTGTFAAGAPSTSAIGAMKITYDTNSHAYTLDAFDLRIGSLTYARGDANIVLANYVIAYNIAFPLFLIGGKVNGSSMAGATNDFMIGYDGFNRVLTDFSYTIAANRGIYGANPITLAAYDPAAVAAVPEPATWASMVAGFALLGATLRRRTAPAISFGGAL